MNNSSQAMQLGLTNPIRTFGEMVEKFGKKFSGNGLYKKIIEEAKDVAPRTSIQKGGYCFAAGTLVHTRNGLVPIEKLKVGDWVLSKPENGEGEEAYKRITNTFCFHEKEVMHVEVYQHISDEEAARFVGSLRPTIHQSLIVTPNHPFWLVEYDGSVIGWSRADELCRIGQTVAVAGGTFAYVSDAASLYRTATEGVAWHEIDHGVCEGRLVDLRQGKLLTRTADGTKSRATNPGFGPYDPGTELLTTVYNIEVEDCHTYFVGEMGVWVHNTNSDGSGGRCRV